MGQTTPHSPHPRRRRLPAVPFFSFLRDKRMPVPQAGSSHVAKPSMKDKRMPVPQAGSSHVAKPSTKDKRMPVPQAGSSHVAKPSTKGQGVVVHQHYHRFTDSTKELLRGRDQATVTGVFAPLGAALGGAIDSRLANVPIFGRFFK